MDSLYLTIIVTCIFLYGIASFLIGHCKENFQIEELTQSGIGIY